MTQSNLPQSVWVCPDPRCDNYAIGHDLVRVTCTKYDPHFADREFPEMVPLAELKAQAAVFGQAAEVVRKSGNRSCKDGEPPVPHVNPQAFARLAAAVGGVGR